jgi:hypothetical protein
LNLSTQFAEITSFNGETLAVRHDATAMIRIIAGAIDNGFVTGTKHSLAI